MLKVDFHLHSKDDKLEPMLTYDTKELIDRAAKLGFDAIAITFHNQFHYTKEIIDYAKEKDVLLIPGIEKNFEHGDHILLYNFTQKELDKIKTFDDLRKVKKDHHAVFAAHPFFPVNTCINDRIFKHMDVIDGLEYSYMYSKLINFNKKAIKVASKYNKTLLANSDLHFIDRMGTNYSLLNCKKTVKDIIKTLKEGPIIIESKPLKLTQLFYDIYRHIVK